MGVGVGIDRRLVGEEVPGMAGLVDQGTMPEVAGLGMAGEVVLEMPGVVVVFGLEIVDQPEGMVGLGMIGEID